MHCDGRGLYLSVGDKGACSWVLRYMLAGKAHTMGLGSYPEVSLAEARAAAVEHRRLAKVERRDPIAHRAAMRAAEQAEAIRIVMTFETVARQFIATKQSGWRDGGKTANQWAAAFRDWAYPVIGSLTVEAVDVAAVMKVLTQDVHVEPNRPPVRLWEARPETASRGRNRIENVLDFARANGWRTGDNPADWATLKFTLPARAKVRRVEHHAALPYGQIGGFMATLQGQAGLAARALEFAILTAGRTNEVLGATWREIDLDRGLWTVPADRMKAGKEHRVPLCSRAVAILAAMKPKGEPQDWSDEFVFPGAKPGRPLSNMAFLMLLRRMGHGDLTAHGFRSTFRDWGSERTTFANEALEMALAHSVGDKVEAAYRRGDLFERRRALMDAWALYCDGEH